ncbi:UDP-N-acetylmuramate dehydrogenase, partial [Gemmiger sp.]|uniref:UDP-N-acetylmuramate dehydrogenase n=1 Tax=Gemmiger sp. TaxID=2049027 RepID=UPI003A950300
MQEKTITALCDALTRQQLPFVQGEPLAAHTTFRIGGPAVFWCAPQDAEQLRETLHLCRENGVRVYLLGNGSNTLFDDAGFDGAVVDMRGLSQMESSDAGTDVVRITAGAGQTLGRLCSKAQALGLTGLEFACGIPGTVGGAVYMNAGAYGGELKDVLESVTFLDDNLQLRTLPAADLAMGYRTSIFEQNPGWCILSVTV